MVNVLFKNMRKLHRWYLLQDNNNGGKNNFSYFRSVGNSKTGLYLDELK